MSFRGRHHDGVGQDKIVIYHNPLGTLTFDPQITTSKTTTIRWLTEAGETITSGTTHDFSYTPTVGPKKCIIEVRGGLGLVTGIDANTDAITEIRNLSKCSNLTVLARLHTNTGLVVELSSIPGAKILDMRSTANGMLIQIARNANYIYLYPAAAIPNIEGSLDQLPATTLEAFIYNQLLITPGSIAHILGARNIRVYNMGWNATQVDSVIDSIYQAVVADANHFTYATPVLQIGGSGGSINAAPSGVYQEATPPTTGLEKVYYLCHLAAHAWAITWNGGSGP